MPLDVDVVATGLAEVQAAVAQLESRATSEFQAIAAATAHRVKVRAQQIVRTVTAPHGTGELAANIGIVEEPRKKQYLIISQAPKSRPDLVPIWLEYGTRRMHARPYLRPSLDAESDRYKSDMAAAADRVAQSLGVG